DVGGRRIGVPVGRSVGAIANACSGAGVAAGRGIAVGVDEPDGVVLTWLPATPTDSTGAAAGPMPIGAAASPGTSLPRIFSGRGSLTSAYASAAAHNRTSRINRRTTRRLPFPLR